MPATVAPWQQDKALNEITQDSVKKVTIKQLGSKAGEFYLQMSVEMPFKINCISSWTHQLRIKKTDCKAIVRTIEGSSLDTRGFVMEIEIGDVHLPRMWVEKHPDKKSEACMLVFQPEFEAPLDPLSPHGETIICLDCSNSMAGSEIQQAKQIALCFLDSYYVTEKLNVIKFGTNFVECPYNSEDFKVDYANLEEFIMSATATMGNSDLWKTLHYLSLLYPSKEKRNILLISDGHIQNEAMTLQLVKQNAKHTRIFTCGVGPAANRHMLRSLSHYGAGAFEHFDAKSKYNWERKVRSQKDRMSSPGCNAVSIKWQQFDTNAPELTYAPAQIQSLFNHERLLVYGFISNCTQATLHALIDNQELQTMVSTTELQKTTGTMLHKLAARAFIRDYEQGVLHENETEHEMKKQQLKSLIIKLSLENSIVTQFTSFVAIEKRTEKESQIADTMNVLELVNKEDVDILPYMQYQEPEGVPWKGLPLADDTWEPEEHLEDCREFQKKIVDAKPKLVKKEIQKLPLNHDLFEADSEAESDWQSDSKGDQSPKKKKKKHKEKEDKSQDEMQKKKSKSAKGKDRPGLECENSCDSLASDSKPKKRTSESREDVKESKKQRREDVKETTKKKAEVKEGKKKLKEESKNKSMPKGKHSPHLDLESSPLEDSFSQAADIDDLDSDSSAEKHNTCPEKEELEEERTPWVSVQQPDSSSSTDDSCEAKVKRKKKKHKKSEEREDSRKVDKYLEKKSTHRKHKVPEKAKAAAEPDSKRPTTPSPVQKSLKISPDERGRKSTDSTGEVSNTKLKSKEAKLGQSYARDVLQKTTVAEGKDKTTNWRVGEEKMKERPTLQSVAESLFEKFKLDSDYSRGGTIGSKKNLSKSDLSAEDVSRERNTLSKEKEIKKGEAKEKLQKRLESEKEEKVKKEQKGFKSLKEIKNAFDVFSISSEEKSEYLDNRKKEEAGHDYRSIDEFRAKDRQLYSRSTRDETDTWAYIAAEGDRDVTEETSDAKQQTVSLGMDMQLEWLSLEDFQKHLDGEDENHLPVEVISSTQLRDAVKNGHYATVKKALNSNEEYNLEQEDSSGMTLVMLAAAGGHDDILRLLIRKGAKVNCRQKNGTTALIHAAEKNNLTTVAILLEAGAYMNLQQNSGETALMKACKRGNYDIVRLMIESGADCNILSKHQNNALHFAKQCNNLLVYDLLSSHLTTVSRVAEDAIREYFEARLSLMEPIFDIACHRLCEGPDYSSEFTYKPPQSVPEGSGILLFIFHANFFGKDVIPRLCGPCSVQAVVLNDKFQLPVFLDSHFIYSFSPIPGLNKLFIRLVEAPTAKVKLLIGAYRVQLTS
ncbi:M-phase phosphoprotein 8 [Sceloporus undulatus]|uniref:M-phase phosphoprotein 8 n=1 Tax=Sceloporus undulatus TaxID=8520 RepID=UPI001C4CD210|nr:M-phase phosphoprotein 8 [Sceloporus undulatus]